MLPGGDQVIYCQVLPMCLSEEAGYAGACSQHLYLIMFIQVGTELSQQMVMIPVQPFF